MMVKATKLQLLEFINERGVVSRFEVVNRFGYTLGGADSMLAWLKRDGLAINDRRGEWTITDLGLKRLIYYRRL
jgi:predicted transcriptional regulator